MTLVRARQQSRGFVRRLLLAVIVGALVGGLLWYVDSLNYGAGINVALIVVGSSAVTLVIWTFVDLSQQLSTALWFTFREQEAAPPARVDHRLMRLRRDVRDATERHDRSDEIQPLLREVVAQRLQSTHGIDLRAEPDRAGEVLHPDLVTYLTHPPHGTGRRSRRELHTVIQRIEEL